MAYWALLLVVLVEELVVALIEVVDVVVLVGFVIRDHHTFAFTLIKGVTRVFLSQPMTLSTSNQVKFAKTNKSTKLLIRPNANPKPIGSRDARIGMKPHLTTNIIHIYLYIFLKPTKSNNDPPI